MVGRRWPREARRAAIIAGAIRQIAAHGLEGLRVREVAQEAGINHATLLHHFPTKEALIKDVVRHIVEDLATPRAPEPPPTDALAEIRQEFEDIRRRLRESPEQFAVLIELLAGARRDPAVAEPMRWLQASFRGHLRGILERGRAEGVLRSDLDPERDASLLAAQIEGIGLRSMLEADVALLDELVDHAAASTERWLTSR